MARSPGLRFCLKFLALLVLLAPLTGCGFKPMYGQFSDGEGNLREVMANIRVASITEDGRPSRLGQVIRNNLLERLTPFGETTDAEYVLKVTFFVEEHGYGIREDESVTLQNLKLVAVYQLEEVTTARVVMESAARALVTFDLVRSDYSNMVARQASVKRLSEDISHQMSNRIGAYFSQLVEEE